ncbi:tetratricopeptide repeat protein [Hymenobacter cellulosilyticus]|uniref:Tetratricopeptide repeat protein n=1 Tax=Hymenobacter cellulosilyticus TaxID=2932248 RepID=A0A8T9Q6A2_9BACT|nr:tetratricopeptide repeat protein [Hymenobacter cellulosilyticus]UOQ73087.1 hypothetical protein MUN79_03680 [Hymenobacter cellulosilyticus]
MLNDNSPLHHFTISPLDSLDDLFARLRHATTPTEIEALQNGIWQLWLMTGDQRLDKELEAGLRALAAGDYTAAIRVFTAIIEEQPEFAEAWNKRATAYFLRASTGLPCSILPKPCSGSPGTLGPCRAGPRFCKPWATTGPLCGPCGAWKHYALTCRACKLDCTTCATSSRRIYRPTYSCATLY